jgi:urease accessory protein
VAGESAAIECRSHTPLRLLLPRARGRTVWAVAASHGGGLVGGDHVALDLGVGEDAQACLTTQAETKVYRSADAPGRQSTRARVARGGLLAVLPEPVSAYAGSAYEQAQRFELAAGGSLVLLDTFTAGRSARGERWAFRSLRTANEVALDGRLVLADALRLAEGEGPPVATRMAGLELYVTVVLLGPRVADDAAALLADVAARPAAPAPVLVAASPLPSLAARGGGSPGTSPLSGGVLLRLAAAEVEVGLAALRAALAFLPGLLGEDPLSRRP